MGKGPHRAEAQARSCRNEIVSGGQNSRYSPNNLFPILRHTYDAPHAVPSIFHTPSPNMPELPELQYTPVESIPATVNLLRTAFNTHKTRHVEFRLKQLRKLYWG